MSAADERAVVRLLHRYAELVDDGDFAGVGELMAHASFVSTTGRCTGAAEVTGWFERTIRRFEDGTPRTSHVTTNITVDVDERAGIATAKAYFTVLQQAPGQPLRVIGGGRYHDEFARLDGEWHFTRRRPELRLAGDLSAHLVPAGR
ncbi:3-phenylpropionate/cinnamic acid dioxygenase small subunit [Crossiella equi]|uniref:3-phenylpropionate/cinnamic acid dioxygenase small subunit n=1 Tax=Crossiella equi TaxID=130796 RepID=A0ABS5A4K9_9PSEU|nr:nuclear transport factor 2 family protein [Crossiella equi]MBP2471222.1 3-phenylpropionate/cinnamic acid dioxygenase small subunit [Crossiella equi]